MSEWFKLNCGLQRMYIESIEDCKRTLEHLGEHHAAHMDLAGAYYRASQHQAALRHLNRAEELGYPLPGLIHNYRACIAAASFDLKALQEHLRAALRQDPYHFVVARNSEMLRRWLVDGGPIKNTPLVLEGAHEFQLFEPTAQPSLPGPLPDDFDQWLDLPRVPSTTASAARRHLNILS
jgi:tetratricopeptide (TPR) repeat protein